ncbi:putative voltage-gated potassium channel [Campylobacter lari]|uniref:potassium channel family protein n=1 Tax=Campylobacter lari TaxID=201 RepID=UPI0021539837|nr:ion channel [Campylobacter lari]MCR6519690.1 ion channel [Campylobacter lari]MCR6531071.1 ion channel [Campylobacter lari]
MLYHRLLNHYISIYHKSTKRFLFVWTLLAMVPLFCSFLFDELAIYATGKITSEILFLILNIIPIMVAIALMMFLLISIWAAFSSKINIKEKFFIILYAYVLIWFAYGNLYYFSCDVDNYNRMLIATQKNENLDIVDLQEKIIEVQFQTPIRGIHNFWSLNDELKPQIQNRIKGLVDCYYFSGVTMLTIGFGDVTPVSSLLRLFSVFQGFLGQVIVVIAMGLWINQAGKQ